jgi:predicted RNase H-like HicB family nuclease
MKHIQAVIQSDGDWYVARCLNLPVTTQGESVEQAKQNLREAVELYLETWGPDELQPASEDIIVTSLAVAA